MATRATPSKGANILAWILQLLLAAAFAMAGYAKLSGAADMVALFESIGVGQWFRYVTGAVEVIGAILLLIPGRAASGALLLAPTMVGAIITHLFLVGGSAIPATVLLALTLTVLWLRRDQLVPLLGRARLA
jgi:uncharacterized membrane protein YphA (DoxX/SURF4 family)